MVKIKRADDHTASNQTVEETNLGHLSQLRYFCVRVVQQCYVNGLVNVCGTVLLSLLTGLYYKHNA
jgi:hypothetical protein